MDAIKLIKPDLKKGLPLMEALNLRRTIRDLKPDELSLEHLSEILWAANGVNREDGKRTAPSACNKQMTEVYAILPDGIYFYDAPAHELKPVAKGDFRKLTAVHEFAFSAPLNLIFAADFDKMEKMPRQEPEENKISYARVEAGHQSENVHLYCASEGLGAAVRIIIPREELAKVMGLKPNQKIILAQTIGYPKLSDVQPK
ncbi:MAG: SagB/ThcOx family dehydrogenase [Patescibacteria group bacterium]|jgi:nitroreductase